MRKIYLVFALLMGMITPSWADQIQVSTTLPDEGRPEHVYTLVSGNGLYANALTAPTQTAENYGLFAFYAVEGKTNAYYIYSHSAQKWLTYTTALSYGNTINFVSMQADKANKAYFLANQNSAGWYEFRPYTTSGSNDKYLNWFQGTSANPLDGNTTLGLWQQGGSDDGGSRWTVAEVIIEEYTYEISIPDGQTLKIGDKIFKDGDTYTLEGKINKNDITVVAPAGKFAAVKVDDVAKTINVYFATLPTQAKSETYTNAVVYPAQQTEVGEAKAEEVDGVYTLSNRVLAASFMKLGESVYFAGSDAMNLLAGTELFTVAFGSGDNVPASAMTLKSIGFEDLVGKATAVGGAEHFNGKRLVAKYEYAYKDSVVNIEWSAVLRDGSHYLRTEMNLEGVHNVDMFNVIPLIYNVDVKAAGSTPKTIGNTRGAVLMSNKIFAGLETPTAYNTVGGATGEEDNWNLTKTYDAINLPVEAWVQVEADDVPARVEEATGKNYPNVYAYKQTNVELKKNQKVEVMLQYKTGSHRLNLGGVDLLDSKGAIVASDYHSGFTGANHQNNTYTFYVPNDGVFSVRVFVEDKTETITATSEMITKVYTAKEGVVVNSDVVGIQGRWSRNTTLEKGETWKVAAVVGLVAQDGTEALENIHKTQKRRSFLAYSERERAVPWRAMPMYLTWYELQINRNNAEPGREHLDNTKAVDVMDVLSHWKSDMYDRYGIAPKVFIIDDGWDKYGEWKFHSSFPNEMRDMSKAANEMDNAGIGAWLGPVGGYGNSGNHRRNYWKDKGQMQLSNPAYYKAFKDAAYNLVKNQGDNYVFFKFDGISGQFSSVGPDNGDTGNENAEGIIRLERFVREQLREDIFFNTSVGTWASPFWYQITDATWRQENDWGELGYNKLRRERWITYRDNLVHQNYVTNSPICPINTLMTHGFILTKFGPPAGDERTYDVVRRELRCAFLCGSGMVELYNDYDLMNSINNGKLWADLAECIAWQKRNADVLPDIHWVGGDPEDGSKENIYGWASWNGTKSTLALRNGGNDAKSYTFTLREALNIPANVNGSIVLRSSFSEQDALSGLTEGEPIGIDTKLTVTLAGSSVYSFDGLSSTATIQEVGSIALTTENGENKLPLNKTLVLRADVAPAEATYPVLTWTSSNPEVATVSDGLVVPVKEGETTITVTAKDGSGVSKSIKITVTPKVLEPYATNFDKNANPVNTDRYITNIVFAEEGAATQTVEVGVKKPYIDFSADADRLLTCTPGANVTAQINKSGNWMNGYVYIDLDGDQQFSFREGSTDQTGTEVMSFSFYNGVFGTNDAGVNSAGDALSGNARNTMTLPPFKAPAEEGDYRIRFKMDWNSIDAGGQIAADGTCTGENGILANRGSIVDLTLRVTEPTGIERVEADTTVENEYYDLSGRKLNAQPEKGVFIKNHQKVIR